MARPQKPYRPSWGGDPIVGLYRCPDGRWRINATGEKYTCPDERLAVARYLAWKARQGRAEALVPIPLDLAETVTPIAPHPTPPEPIDAAGVVDFLLRHELGPGLHRATADPELALNVPANRHDPLELLRGIPEQALWAYVRRQLIERPAHVAQMTGLPQLASFATLDVPKPPVRISAVVAAYHAHSGGSERSQRQALNAFERLVDHAGAKTLDDLTDKRLAAFRAAVVDNPALKSSGTITAYFNRVRSVLNVARRGELDGPQIDRALERCKAKLYAPENNVEDDPRPISRKHFRKLLAGCDQTDVPHVWRAMLLLGLNCALYMEDVCDLRWGMFNLKKRTFLTRRKKRGRCLRAAVLWPETVAALRAIPRRGQSPYVFVSTHGTRYNKNTKINDFKDFREKVGVAGVTFSHLRDGAYTQASNNPKVKDRYARLLNGHKNPGLEDKYVLRHPEIVKPACDAVYRHYFGSRKRS